MVIVILEFIINLLLFLWIWNFSKILKFYSLEYLFNYIFIFIFVFIIDIILRLIIGKRKNNALESILIFIRDIIFLVYIALIVIMIIKFNLSDGIVKKIIENIALFIGAIIFFYYDFIKTNIIPKKDIILCCYMLILIIISQFISVENWNFINLVLALTYLIIEYKNINILYSLAYKILDDYSLPKLGLEESKVLLFKIKMYMITIFIYLYVYFYDKYIKLSTRFSDYIKYKDNIAYETIFSVNVILINIRLVGFMMFILIYLIIKNKKGKIIKKYLVKEFFIFCNKNFKQ